MCTFGAPPASASPSARIPVPASRITCVPSPAVTSTHDVFPPKQATVGPGTGTDPRTPQKVTRTGSFPVDRPKHDHRAVQPDPSDQRQRDDLDVDYSLVAPDAVAPESRSPLLEGPRHRKVLGRERISSLVERANLRSPARHRDGPGFLEQAAEELRGRIVEEHDRPRHVNEDRGQ